MGALDYREGHKKSLAAMQNSVGKVKDAIGCLKGIDEDGKLGEALQDLDDRLSRRMSRVQQATCRVAGKRAREGGQSTLGVRGLCPRQNRTMRG